MAGCQVAPPSGTPQSGSQAPAPALGTVRNIQALDQAGFERMMNQLPKQLTNEEAARMLVKLPVGAPRISIGNRRISTGAMGDGNEQAMGYEDKDKDGHAMAYEDKGHEMASEAKAHEEPVQQHAAPVALAPNLDYRFLAVGGAAAPYISYYPYVYNFSNSHWAPYAAYWSGRYYYPYYQGYGSLYAPYTYEAIMPYGGVYAMRTGTIAR
jgi:hypothetical protein